MKKFLSALLVCVMLFFSKTPGYANSSYTQEDFLADMAAGIKERVAYSKDHTDNDQETYLKLVEFELEHIEKYNSVSFEDRKFDTLAHQYINACLMQKIGAENKRNEDLYSLWGGGRAVRSGLISYFYEMYNLDLTDEEIAEYRNSSSAVSYSVVSSSSSGASFSLYPGDISFVSSSAESGYMGRMDLNYSFRNNSDNDIYLCPVVELYDSNEKLLGTTWGYTSNGNANGSVASGQIVKCKAPVPEDNLKAAYAKLVKVEYSDSDSGKRSDYTFTDKEYEKSIIYFN